MESHHPWWACDRTVVCVETICEDRKSTLRVARTYALWCV